MHRATRRGHSPAGQAPPQLRVGRQWALTRTSVTPSTAVRARLSARVRFAAARVPSAFACGYRARARLDLRARSLECASTYASSRRRIIRWYCVSPFAAADLKNSTLFLLSVIVILMSSSRNASSCGEGRKSRTTLGSPIGSFAYLIFALIDNLSLAPVTSPNYPNNAGAMRESNGQYTTRDTPKTEVSLLLGAAMPGVFSDDSVRIRKRMLRQQEWHTMLALVFRILTGVPFEARFWHATSLPQLTISIYGLFYGYKTHAAVACTSAYANSGRLRPAG
jgi:hypothetical protein